MTSTIRGFRGSAARTLLRVTGLLLCIVAISPPAIAKADAVLTWNEVAARSVVGSPFHQARLMSIVQLAVFEAVNAVTGEYEPYLPVPIVAASGASAEAAAVAAAHRVLTTYLTAPATVAALDAQRAASLAAIPDGAAETNGVIVGEAAAAAMIALRAADGVLPDTFSPSGSTLAGVWQPTGGACTAGVLYHWQDLVPFAIQRPSDFLLEPPPSLTSNRYAMDYLEVNTMGNATSVERPADRAEIARFYAALSPPFMISMAARQIAARKGSSLSENARSFALLMVAINDSLIASFYNKYQYSFWRPVTAIHAGAADGNRKTEGDTTFAPLISTPCFPGYPSNHASGTNGGLEMLRRLFGAAGHEITITATVPPLTTVTPALPGIILTRHYTQLKGIADDVDDARVYGGIHFRFDQQGGNTLGRAVATYVFKNTLRPVNGQE